MKKETPDDEPPGLLDRLLAAVLAPVFFGIGTAIVLSMVSYEAIWWFFRPSNLGRPALVVLLAASIAGFCLGTKGFATFFGHAFLSNPPSQRDPLVTVLIWVAIAAFGYYLSTIV